MKEITQNQNCRNTPAGVFNQNTQLSRSFKVVKGKLLLFAFACMLSMQSFADVCIVTIPDAAFKAYLVDNNNINTNSNTEIECSEAAAFAGTISLDDEDIHSLTGIEAFTNLTSLHCDGTEISSLNLL